MPTPILTSAQKTKVRGNYAAQTYLSLHPNTVIMQATVDTVPTGAAIASFTVNTPTTGAVTDVWEGYTIYITSSGVTDLREARSILRSRKDASGSTIYVNWTSEVINPGDVVSVVADVRTWYREDRFSGGSYFKDYDLSFRQLPPVCNALRSVYAGNVNASDVLEVTLDGSADAWADGATIATHAWTVPSGVTITTGSTSTESITVECDPGHYVVRKVTTDSNGTSYTRYCHIFAHDDSTFPTTVYFASEDRPVSVNVTGDVDNGWLASITAFDGVDTVLDNTLCVVWQEQYFADESTPDTTFDNVRFVGRLRTENTSTRISERGVDEDVSYELESGAAQLQELDNYIIDIVDKASPTAWRQVDKPTPYRMAVYVLAWDTTYLLAHPLSADAIDATYRAQGIETTDGMVYDSLEELLDRINARMEFDPDGGLRMARVGYIIDTPNSTRMDFTTEDLSAWSITRDHAPTVSQVNVTGQYYVNPGNAGTKLRAAVAPGAARGVGGEVITMRSQTLTAGATANAAQTELNNRVAAEFGFLNEVTRLIVSHPDNYTFIIPSLSLPYTFTFASTDTVTGRVFDTETRWYCESINLDFDIVGGLVDITATYTKESVDATAQAVALELPSAGTPGQINLPPAVYPPIIDIGNPAIFDGIDPDTILPPPTVGDGDALRDGSTVAAWSATQLYIGSGYNLNPPTWAEITPEDIDNLGLIDAKWSWYNERLYMLIQNASGYSKVFDFTSSSGGWAAEDAGGAYTPGTGWTSTPGTTCNNCERIFIVINIAAGTTVTKIEFDYERTVFDDTTAKIQAYSAPSGSAPRLIDQTFTADQSSGTITWTGSVSGVKRIRLQLRISQSQDGSGNGVITEATVEGTGTSPAEFGETTASGTGYAVTYTDNPFAVTPTWNTGAALSLAAPSQLRNGASTGEIYVYDAQNAESQYSTDAGATWAAAVSAGTAVTDGTTAGFDTGKAASTAVYAGVTDKVVKSAAGGAYSDLTGASTSPEDPLCIYIPFYQFGTASTINSGTTPDTLIAPRAAVGGVTLWTYSGGSLTAVTPGGGVVASAHGAGVMWRDSDKLFAIMDDTTNQRLYTSSNGGTSWTNQGTIDNATYIAGRRGDTNARQLYIAGTGGTLWYVGDYSTISTRTSPFGSDDILGIEPYG